MKQTQYLTNERLKYKFYSFFDLANYGIQVAKEKMQRDEVAVLSEVMKELEKLPDTVKH